MTKNSEWSFPLLNWCQFLEAKNINFGFMPVFRGNLVDFFARSLQVYSVTNFLA